MLASDGYMMSASQKNLKFKYINWRGEYTKRTVMPIEIWFGNTGWHPENQWFLKALDLEKNEERDFALKDIASFEN